MERFHETRMIALFPLIYYKGMVPPTFILGVWKYLINLCGMKGRVFQSHRAWLALMDSSADTGTLRIIRGVGF